MKEYSYFFCHLILKKNIRSGSTNKVELVCRSQGSSRAQKPRMHLIKNLVNCPMCSPSCAVHIPVQGFKINALRSHPTICLQIKMQVIFEMPKLPLLANQQVMQHILLFYYLSAHSDLKLLFPFGNCMEKQDYS